MKKIIHRAHTRGYADNGWLETYHTFSFGSYYNSSRMHFGMLRVLNDDYIEEGKGFSTHPHDNMEIISIPLSGSLAHQDNMGNGSVIKAGEIQVMSAGKGITHSEYNNEPELVTNLLQIWVYPDAQNVEPRYQQMSLADLRKENAFYQVLSPNPDDEGVWIHQNAWFHMGVFDADMDVEYKLKSGGNGVYAFVIEGLANTLDTDLNERDGIGVSDVDKLDFRVKKGTKILLMEVPMR